MHAAAFGHFRLCSSASYFFSAFLSLFRRNSFCSAVHSRFEVSVIKRYLKNMTLFRLWYCKSLHLCDKCALGKCDIGKMWYWKNSCMDDGFGFFTVFKNLNIWSSKAVVRYFELESFESNDKYSWLCQKLISNSSLERLNKRWTTQYEMLRKSRS